MFGELGIEPSCLAVAEHFRDVLTALVIDTSDEPLAEPIARLGIQPLVAQTLMHDRSDRLALAGELLEFAAALERAI
jgi:LPPG:FO 2-phospho-L-lactate transferase